MSTPEPAGGADRIELLRSFLRIVEAGSLSAAAAQLGTTQPTISRRLQQLERLLGLRLLRRSTHGLALTEDGERCLAHAREVLDGWSVLEETLRGSREGASGLLRVQAPHAFGQDQLIAPLAEFLAAHPEVSVEWRLQDRMPDFIADGIDCAIRVGWVEEPSVVAVRLADVPRIVVAAPGLWGDGPPPEDEALRDLPWLALTTYYRDEVTLTREGAALRFPIRPRLGTDSLHALRAAALAGLGAAIVSAWAVAEDLRLGRLVQLAPDWRAAPLPVSLVYPAGRLQPARLRHFIALMRERMPGLTGLEKPK
ncbi:LysR family transcriptional regulator [Pseudoroseomonas cervicalis]|uniref:LysR family transcriptional regulator n=1 Tax=Teichococcus cervicalis TaxID=204525 RepID=UPI0022F1B844|nr:LysR family transcriptional regulator [Pseudoroseomonas cervicalis]WBV43438.1 LysR family transcriptional regulator [Pseudoroseomonas cervicalis]